MSVIVVFLRPLGLRLVGIGSDDTLYAKIDGIVRYERLGRDKKKASVYPVAVEEQIAE